MTSEYRKYLRNQTLPGMTEMETDMMKGLPIPPIEKPYPGNAATIALPSHEECRSISSTSLADAIARRRSRRSFTDAPLSLREVAFLLWATQGVRGLIRDGLVTLRTVPSGGGMHPFETYVFADHVNALDVGVYRYLAIEHHLLPLPRASADLPGNSQRRATDSRTSRRRLPSSFGRRDRTEPSIATATIP